jgi:hypothetical protein
MKHQYPLDFDALKKGDEINYARLCEIVGKRQNPRKQRLAFLGLKRLIEKKRRGFICRVISDGGPEAQEKLVILLDPVAAALTHRRCHNGIRQLRRGVEAQARIDTSNLNELQKKDHQYHLQLDSLTYRALRLGQRSAAGYLAARRRQMVINGQTDSMDLSRIVTARIEERQRRLNARLFSPPGGFPNPKLPE